MYVGTYYLLYLNSRKSKQDVVCWLIRDRKSIMHEVIHAFSKCLKNRNWAEKYQEVALKQRTKTPIKWLIFLESWHLKLASKIWIIWFFKWFLKIEFFYYTNESVLETWDCSSQSHSFYFGQFVWKEFEHPEPKNLVLLHTCQLQKHWYWKILS